MYSPYKSALDSIRNVKDGLYYTADLAKEVSASVNSSLFESIVKEQIAPASRIQKLKSIELELQPAKVEAPSLSKIVSFPLKTTVKGASFVKDSIYYTSEIIQSIPNTLETTANEVNSISTAIAEAPGKFISDVSSAVNKVKAVAGSIAIPNFTSIKKPKPINIIKLVSPYLTAFRSLVTRFYDVKDDYTKSVAKSASPLVVRQSESRNIVKKAIAKLGDIRDTVLNIRDDLNSFRKKFSSASASIVDSVSGIREIPAQINATSQRLRSVLSSSPLPTLSSTPPTLSSAATSTSSSAAAPVTQTRAPKATQSITETIPTIESPSPAQLITDISKALEDFTTYQNNLLNSKDNVQTRVGAVIDWISDRFLTIKKAADTLTGLFTTLVATVTPKPKSTSTESAKFATAVYPNGYFKRRNNPTTPVVAAARPVEQSKAEVATPTVLATSSNSARTSSLSSEIKSPSSAIESVGSIVAKLNQEISTIKEEYVAPTLTVMNILKVELEDYGSRIESNLQRRGLKAEEDRRLQSGSVWSAAEKQVEQWRRTVVTAGEVVGTYVLRELRRSDLIDELVTRAEASGAAERGRKEGTDVVVTPSPVVVASSEIPPSSFSATSEDVAAPVPDKETASLVEEKQTASETRDTSPLKPDLELFPTQSTVGARNRTMV